MRRLANKTPDVDPGYFSAKPPFGPRQAFILYTASSSDPAKTEEDWVAADPEKFTKLKKAYDKSRRSVTRTGKWFTTKLRILLKLQLFVILVTQMCSLLTNHVPQIMKSILLISSPELQPWVLNTTSLLT